MFITQKNIKKIWTLGAGGLLLALFFCLGLFSRPTMAAAEVLIDINPTYVGNDRAQAFGAGGVSVGVITPGNSISQLTMGLMSPDGTAATLNATLCPDFNEDQSCDETGVAADAAIYVPSYNADNEIPTFVWTGGYATTPGENYLLTVNTNLSGGNSISWYGDNTLLISGSSEIAYFTGGGTHDWTPTLRVEGTLSPEISGQVYWAGAGTVAAYIGRQWSVPIYWNVCASYGDIQQLSAASDMDGEGHPSVELIQDKTTYIGPQRCSGIAYLQGAVAATTPQTGTSTIYLYNEGGTIAESSVFNYQITYEGQTGTNYIDNSIVSPLTIPLGGAATTTLPFSYDLTGLDWTDGEICVYNEISHTKTDYCRPVTSAAATDTMDYPNPPGAYQLTATYRLYSSGGANLLNSDPFTLNWYSTAPETTIGGLTGVSNHELACSDTDWADTDWWTQLRCKTFEASLNIMDAIASAPKRLAESTTETLKGMFPFSTIIHVKESWDASQISELPADLSWVNAQIDENGNITLTSPSIPGLATTTSTIFGPDASGDDNAFATMLRSLSKYLMLGVFFLYSVIVRAVRVKDKLTGSDI